MSSGWYQSPLFCRPSPRSPAPCPCRQVSPRAAAGRGAPGPRCHPPTPRLLCPSRLAPPASLEAPEETSVEFKSRGVLGVEAFRWCCWSWEAPPPGWFQVDTWRWVALGESCDYFGLCEDTRGRGEAHTDPLPAPLGRMAGQVAPCWSPGWGSLFEAAGCGASSPPSDFPHLLTQGRGGVGKGEKARSLLPKPKKTQTILIYLPNKNLSFYFFSYTGGLWYILPLSSLSSIFS